MIQQISIAPVQPSVQPQPTQQTDPQQGETSFQSVLQKAAGATGKPKEDGAVSVKQQPGKGKSTDLKSDPANVPVSPVNFSLLAAAVQQLQQPQNVPIADSAPAASVPEVQNVTLQPAAETAQTASAQTGPVGKNPTAATPVLSVSSSALPQNTAPQNPIPAGTPAVTANVQPALAPSEQPAILTTSPVTEKAESTLPSDIPATAPSVPQQTPNQAVQQNQTAKPQLAASAAPSVPAEFSAHVESATQTKETVSLPVKQTTDDTGSNSQPQATLSDLMHSGNVIIKISDVPQNSPKPAVHQVVDQIAQNYKAGTPKFEMDLYPKDLGKVTVKMAMENGTLTVEIAASNPKTQSMLLSDSGGIRSMIETTVNHPVQVTQPSQSSQDKQWYQQDQSHSQQQQQERQQKESSVYRVNDDSDLNTDDFLSVMQQLRIKAYSV